MHIIMDGIREYLLFVHLNGVDAKVWKVIVSNAMLVVGRLVSQSL